MFIPPVKCYKRILFGRNITLPCAFSFMNHNQSQTLVPTTMESPEIVNFGRCLMVPSVQELLTKEAITKIPSRYVHHDQGPIAVSEDASSLQFEYVPVIDLHSLLFGASLDSEMERGKLHSACQNWGFFQVINHGVSASLLEDLKREITNFLKLPLEVKKKLWQTPESNEGFGQHFVVSEDQKLDWSDMFYITMLPNSERVAKLYENIPTTFRETLETYSIEVNKLAMAILGEMAKALRMDVTEMTELFSNGMQSMRMNYYPPCPEPNMAIGITPHSDAGALTILYQLNETQGLQIRKDGKWVNVKPLPNAFLANIGDMLEVFSNGVYRSIEHRAIVNSAKERLSIATFNNFHPESVVGPAHSLVGPNSKAVFRQVPIKDYFKEFFARKLNGKSFLDFMKLEVVEG